MKVVIPFALFSLLVDTASGQSLTKKAVLLSTQTGGLIYQREAFEKETDEALLGQLQMAQYSVSIIPKSKHEENLCDDACMKSWADKQRADAVILAKVFNLPKNVRHLTVRAYLVGNEKPGRTIEQDCENCSVNLIREKLLTMLGQVLANEPTTSPVRPALETPIQTVEKKSSGKKIALYTVGGIGVALAVGSAIALGLAVKEHNTPACATNFPGDRRCPFLHDSTTGITLSAIGLGVGVIAAPVAFILASRSDRSKASTLHLYPMGTGLALSGEF